MHIVRGPLVAVWVTSRATAALTKSESKSRYLGVAFANATLNATVLASKYPSGSVPEVYCK